MKEYLVLVFLIVNSAADITFAVQKVLVTWTKWLYVPVCTLPAPTSLLSGAARFSLLTELIYMFLSEAMSRAVCHAVFQAGLPIFNIRQPERIVLVGRGKENKFSHCKTGYAFAAAIAYYSRRGKCLSFFKPRFSLSFPSYCGLLCSSENSTTSTPPATTTVFLSPQHPIK